MFEKEPDLKDKIFEELKGDRIKLRKYPDVIRAMYAYNLDEIPEDLRVEENRHRSMVIEEHDQHVSRRESQI